MRILISNDDGVDAIGITELANALNRAGHQVTVIAPSGNRSGFSHSLTIRREMEFCENSKGYGDGYDEGITVYSLNGTPADCVKLGVNVFKGQFDVVVSGINNGPNLGVDTMYSGTVGAAMEGANNGLKGIAVSLVSFFDAEYFQTASKFIVDNLSSLYDSMTTDFVWNVNVPNKPIEAIKGTKFTKIGKVFYTDIYEKTEVEGIQSYTLLGDPMDDQTNDESTDVGSTLSGYVSVTPIKVDRTMYELLEKIV